MSGASVKRKAPPPLSIRLSWEERARLEREAGKLTLTAYARQKLFDGEVEPHRLTRKRHSPTVDHVFLGQVLGLLGKSELASSLCLLAVAAESGSLPVSEETETELQTACDHIEEIRLLLIKALGVKAQ